MNSRDLIDLINAAPPAGKSDGRRSVKFEVPGRIFAPELVLNFGAARIKAKTMGERTDLAGNLHTTIRVWVDEATDALEAAGLLTRAPPTKPDGDELH